ncbi:MAG: hypothetical protein Q8S73_12290 [Deltaproteobacteria bacterium]|nr:hypothetical protein [Myxococcales bacterium]MDP3214878.1 hypothetical protein [Deltaproteobacteria bacterium]
MTLDRGRIDAILDAAADALEGDWLLVGGAAAATWFLPGRVTEDVALVSLRGAQDDRLALLTLAERLGLSPEAFNSTADFFVHRIPGWTAEMEPLRLGRGARIHRPTVTLFILLKVGRLSEVDLDDCLALLSFARGTSPTLDRDRVVAALEALPPTTDAALLDRRRALRDAL